MNTATDWYVNRQLTQAQSQYQMALSRISRARNLRELVQGSNVHVQSFLRSLVTSDAARLRSRCDDKAKEFVEAQLATVAAAPFADRKLLIGRLQQTDWILLRGNFPALCRHVEIESRKLLQPTKP